LAVHHNQRLTNSILQLAAARTIPQIHLRARKVLSEAGYLHAEMEGREFQISRIDVQSAPRQALKYPSRWLRSPIPAATLRLALASNGITITDMAATMMPGILRSGIAWVIYASMRWMRLIASSVNSISPSQYPTRTDRFDATHFYLQKKKTAASGLVSRAPDAKCDQRFSAPQRYNW